jgi:hypothetical protein
MVEGLTGTRMPRRPAHASSTEPWYQRVIGILKERHTWTALFYMVLQMPLGIVYFVIACTGLAVGLGLTVGPFIYALYLLGWIQISGDVDVTGPHPVAIPFVIALGVVILTLLLHLARGIGRMHGHLAKALLVRPAT